MIVHDSTEYNIRLTRLDLPVVDIGSSGKRVLVPPELCNIYPGQPYANQLDKDETKTMINIACRSPQENAATIRDQGFSSLGLLSDTPTDTLTAFGISVERDMTSIHSRVLPAANIAYRSGPLTPREGSWNLIKTKFHAGGVASKWAVLLVQQGNRVEFSGRSDQRLISFLGAFARICKECGVAIPDRPSIIMETGGLPRMDNEQNRRRAMEQIDRVFTQNRVDRDKPSFVLVLLPTVDRFLYPGIKCLGDVKYGFNTVHMVLNEKTCLDTWKQAQYFANVALKVNIKLGGVNHVLHDKDARWLKAMDTMVVGIDVTHPGHNSPRGTPSIAAVVASVDTRFVHYPASLSLQKPNENKEAKEARQNSIHELLGTLILVVDGGEPG